MKKSLTILGTMMVSLILTFFIVELFSLYHFGNRPTFTTFTYILFLFCFITYILLFFVYIIGKKRKKEKIGKRKIISFILFFFASLFLLGFIVILNLDWVTYYSNYPSAPFYVFILVRGLEFLLPSLLLFVGGIVLLLTKKTNKKS